MSGTVWPFQTAGRVHCGYSSRALENDSSAADSPQPSTPGAKSRGLVRCAATTPVAIALPMTVDANKPSNSSGNSVTSSNVIRGENGAEPAPEPGSVAGVEPGSLIAVPAHPHLASRTVDRDHEVRDQRHHALAAVAVDDGGDVVGAVPEGSARDAERAAGLVLGLAADHVLDVVLAGRERRQHRARDAHLGQRERGDGVAISDARETDQVAAVDRSRGRDVVLLPAAVAHHGHAADAVERLAMGVVGAKRDLAGHAVRPPKDADRQRVGIVSVHGTRRGYSRISSTTRRRDLADAAERIVRSALAVRPCLPITLPRSSSATLSSNTSASGSDTSSTSTSSGLSTRPRARKSTSSRNAG